MFDDVLVVNQNNAPQQMECRAVVGQYLRFLLPREKFIMAAKEDVGPTLPVIFSSVWKIYEYTETTDDGSGSDIYQSKVKEAIDDCEKATLMVNQLHLFSDNELIEEVSTADMRYLLLPAFLGFFTSKLTTGDRMENLKKAQVYYADFLRLCRSYGVTTVEVPTIAENTEEASNGAGPMSRGPPSQEDMKRMASQRAAKLERFKRQKELEKNLKELYIQVQKEHVDDDVKREYFNTLLAKWVDTSLEEMTAIKDELPMLLHMLKMRSQGGGAAAAPPKRKQQETPPLRPFIITKSELQKQVFGLGYPGVPTYTLDQFYDAQVAAGMLPQPGDAQPAPVSEKAEAEKAEIEKERKIETDDPEARQKQMEWDEYTDDNRRGWGNMKNQG